jgi:hypothetical protein
MSKLKIKSSAAPAIFTARNGKRYVAAGTISEVNGIPVKNGVCVADHITVSDLEWIPPIEFRKLDVLEMPKVVTVPGSKIGVTYQVTYLKNEKVNCTCPGFTYRRKCKHHGLS